LCLGEPDAKRVTRVCNVSAFHTCIWPRRCPGSNACSGTVGSENSKSKNSSVCAPADPKSMISACFQAGARFTRALEAEAALAGGEWRANSQSTPSQQKSIFLFLQNHFMVLRRGHGRRQCIGTVEIECMIGRRPVKRQIDCMKSGNAHFRCLS